MLDPKPACFLFVWEEIFDGDIFRKKTSYNHNLPIGEEYSAVEVTSPPGGNMLSPLS